MNIVNYEEHTVERNPMQEVSPLTDEGRNQDRANQMP